MDFAKTARNLAVADIALAFARDRVATMLPGVEPRKKRRPGAKTLLLGGGVAAAVVALFFKRDTVKGLLPGGDTETAPAPAPDAYTPPPVSNYDAAGPVANTATAVPVPPAYEEPAIDEAAEEAAAAAEAANIGGFFGGLVDHRLLVRGRDGHGGRGVRNRTSGVVVGHRRRRVTGVR